MALWILPKRGLLCVGAKANVPLCGGKKLNKKMCGGEKKKYRRVGKVCRLSSCPFVIWSVCLCLSVKMVYASLVCLTVTVRVSRSVFTLAANVPTPGAGADFKISFIRDARSFCFQLVFLRDYNSGSCARRVLAVFNISLARLDISLKNE